MNFDGCGLWLGNLQNPMEIMEVWEITWPIPGLTGLTPEISSFKVVLHDEATKGSEIGHQITLGVCLKLCLNPQNGNFWYRMVPHSWLVSYISWCVYNSSETLWFVVDISILFLRFMNQQTSRLGAPSCREFHDHRWSTPGWARRAIAYSVGEQRFVAEKNMVYGR